jgi:hypothetical protein
LLSDVEKDSTKFFTENKKYANFTIMETFKKLTNKILLPPLPRYKDVLIQEREACFSDQVRLEDLQSLIESKNKQDNFYKQIKKVRDFNLKVYAAPTVILCTIDTLTRYEVSFDFGG